MIAIFAKAYNEIIITELLSVNSFKEIEQEIYDFVGLTIQLAIDEIQDLYENLLLKMPRNKITESPLLPDFEKLQKMIRQLSAFYQISP